MVNIISNLIKQQKIKRQIEFKYNEILKINDEMVHADTMQELLSYFEKQEKVFDEMEKIDVGYKKIISTSKDDFEGMITSQIKKKYFATINHFLLDFNESDSLGYINGFINDLKSCQKTKYGSFIKSFIADAQSIVDNHSIIYNNYRKNPIKYNTDKLSEPLLEYICRCNEVCEEEISSKFKLDYMRVQKLFDYFAKQKIITEKKENGKRDVLIKNPMNVFSTGLNPNELSYFSVTYNYVIDNYDGNKSLLEKIDSDITGAEFEKITKNILEKNEFVNVKITPISGDFGVDVIAEKDSIKYVIQCKKYSSSVGIKAVQEIIGAKVMNNAHVAVVLTNNFFTKSAIELANKNNVLLWDRTKLEELIKKCNE